MQFYFFSFSFLSGEIQTHHFDELYELVRYSNRVTMRNRIEEHKKSYDVPEISES